MAKPRKFNKELHEESRRREFKGKKGKKENLMELKERKNVSKGRQVCR